MFSRGSVFELLICLLRNRVFNFLLSELYPRENQLIPELRKCVSDDWVLTFLDDANLRHVESSVRCHWKYKNSRIKVDVR